MMQNLKTRVHCSADSDRKLAFLRSRKVSRIDRKHRDPRVEKDQFVSRAESFAEIGLPNNRSEDARKVL